VADAVAAIQLLRLMMRSKNAALASGATTEVIFVLAQLTPSTNLWMEETL